MEKEKPKAMNYGGVNRLHGGAFRVIVADPSKDDEVVVRSDFLDHADAGEEPKGNEGGGYHPDSNSDGEHGWSSVLQGFGGVRHGFPIAISVPWVRTP